MQICLIHWVWGYKVNADNKQNLNQISNNLNYIVRGWIIMLRQIWRSKLFTQFQHNWYLIIN